MQYKGYNVIKLLPIFKTTSKNKAKKFLNLIFKDTNEQKSLIKKFNLKRKEIYGGHKLLRKQDEISVIYGYELQK